MCKDVSKDTLAQYAMPLIHMSHAALYMCKAHYNSLVSSHDTRLKRYWQMSNKNLKNPEKDGHMAEQIIQQIAQNLKYIRAPRREEKFIKVIPVAFKVLEDNTIRCRSPVTSDRNAEYYHPDYIDGILLLTEFVSTRNAELIYCKQEKIHMCNLVTNLARALWLSHYGVAEITFAIHNLIDTPFY